MRAVFAALALLSGCSGADVGDYVTSGARSPEYLACGWSPEEGETRELEPLEPGMCWRVRVSENRAVSLVDNACAAEQNTLIYTPGGPVYVWGHVGTKEPGMVWLLIVECPP